MSILKIDNRLIFSLFQPFLPCRFSFGREQILFLKAIFEGKVERTLAHAVRDAGDRLDALLSEGNAPIIRKLGHNLAGKEITTIEELDRALADLRERVVAELAAGAKVRLV